MGKYDDIINLPHYEPRHPRMSMEKRAAQFSPFAALSGHGDAVKEAERLTDSYIELDESQKELINSKLQKILERLQESPEITITYFVPDKNKSGGSYVNHTGHIKKVDEYTHTLLMKDGTKIPLHHLYDIE